MAYSELVKSFERIRGYMREFYVYGFRTREEFSAKSARSYDNERRRLESILGQYTSSARNASGKRVYLSIDSRSGGSDPLFRLLKACSFTARDITLHFMLLDILSEDAPMTLTEIIESLESYSAGFEQPMQYDESGVRKKLAEYEKLGIVRIEKQGRVVRYLRAAQHDLSAYADALEFFSETGVCGAIGSFVCDKVRRSGVFEFKHHYITHTLDSEVLYELLCAISEKRIVTVEHRSARNGIQHTWRLLPLKIFVSVQNGRRWVMAYSFELHRIKAYRLDYIESVVKCEKGEACPRFDELRGVLDDMQQRMWGVSCGDDSPAEHVEFTVFIGDNEEYIYRRMLREKRCGSVERVDEHTARFAADVKDPGELIPWIRTFIGRIIQLDFSDRTLENRLREDINKMYDMYGIGGDEDAVP
ncbi:MAG: WYL domain-containing protein [Ruminococcaceae bacterium]|nr:WYL domain-containing protein [Oscillospiraceae bacterium]